MKSTDLDYQNKYKEKIMITYVCYIHSDYSITVNKAQLLN
jgi:hypothetical protein